MKAICLLYIVLAVPGWALALQMASSDVQQYHVYDDTSLVIAEQCNSWCDSHTTGWHTEDPKSAGTGTKCSWTACSPCEACKAPPAQAQCSSWCESHTTGWHTEDPKNLVAGTKCSWAACSPCDACREPPQAHSVSHDDGGMEDLRTELKGEHLHRLKQRAHDLGIPQEVIQEAEKDDVLKKAVFEHLIMEKEYGHEVDNHASPPPVYLHPEKNASLLAMPMSKEQLMEEMPISKLQLIDAATAHGMSLVSAAQYADAYLQSAEAYNDYRRRVETYGFEVLNATREDKDFVKELVESQPMQPSDWGYRKAREKQTELGDLLQKLGVADFERRLPPNSNCSGSLVQKTRLDLADEESDWNPQLKQRAAALRELTQPVKDATLQVVNAGMGTTATRALHNEVCALGIPSLHYAKHCWVDSKTLQLQANVIRLYENMKNCAAYTYPRTDKRCKTHPHVEEMVGNLTEIVRSGVKLVSDVPYTLLIPILTELVPRLKVIQTLREPTSWAHKRVEHNPEDVICKHSISNTAAKSYFDMIGCMVGKDWIQDSMEAQGPLGANDWTEGQYWLLGSKYAHHNQVIQDLATQVETVDLELRSGNYGFDYDLQTGVVTFVTPGGQAHDQGIAPGMRITAVNDAPYHSIFSARELLRASLEDQGGRVTMTAAQADTEEFEFRPGSLGMRFDNKTGIVLAVDSDGQAQLKGVEVGMWLIRVDGKKFSDDATQAASVGSDNYKLVMMQAASITVPFAPEPLGLDYNEETGLVLSVNSTGQGHDQGIEPGMRFISVDGEPFSHKALRAASSGDAWYQVGMTKPKVQSHELRQLCAWDSGPNFDEQMDLTAITFRKRGSEVKVQPRKREGVTADEYIKVVQEAIGPKIEKVEKLAVKAGDSEQQEDGGAKKMMTKDEDKEQEKGGDGEKVHGGGEKDKGKE